MATVAFIGSDGAGKTTVIRKIQNDFPVPVKYIYLGLNLESSNYSLPTSRLILNLKLRSIRKKAADMENLDPVYLSTHAISHRRQKRGRLWIAMRTFNRLFEAWYRQIISWFFQARGYLVVYDRHFLFDTAPPPDTKFRQPLANRIFRWFLSHMYPKTDLVLFLDADPETLLKRKQEVPRDYLISQRAAILAQGSATHNFVKIDASQTVEKVYTEAIHHIMRIPHFIKRMEIGDSRYSIPDSQNI